MDLNAYLQDTHESAITWKQIKSHLQNKSSFKLKSQKRAAVDLGVKCGEGCCVEDSTDADYVCENLP